MLIPGKSDKFCVQKFEKKNEKHSQEKIMTQYKYRDILKFR